MMSGMEGVSDTACHTEQIAVICPFPANHFFLFHRAEDGQTCAQSGCWKSGNIAADQGCPAMFRRQCCAFGKSKQLLIAAAVGGKDSMSGSFMDMDVPPTLISFAIAPIKAGEVLSPEFKEKAAPFIFSPVILPMKRGRHGRLYMLCTWPEKSMLHGLWKTVWLKLS